VAPKVTEGEDAGPHPFMLSLSKHCRSSGLAKEEEQPFDFAQGERVGLDKPAQIMYARYVHWLSPKDKTGAKLVSMHETV